MKVVKRLDPEAIPHEKETSRLRVPDGHREHADEFLDRRLDAPAFERAEDDLGVRLTAESRPVSRQLVTQLEVVVHFAVEDDSEALRRRPHRLMTCWREVDDREPAESQRDARVRL